MIKPIEDFEFEHPTFREAVLLQTVNELVEQANNGIEIMEKMTSTIAGLTEKVKSINNTVNELVLRAKKEDACQNKFIIP